MLIKPSKHVCHYVVKIEIKLLGELNLKILIWSYGWVHLVNIVVGTLSGTFWPKHSACAALGRSSGNKVSSIFSCDSSSIHDKSCNDVLVVVVPFGQMSAMSFK